MPKHTALALYRSSRRWTETEARDVLRALDASRLSTAAFAAREGLDAQRLYWWRRRLGGDTGAPSFVEVTASSTVTEHVEVMLRNGRIVRFSPAIDTTVLRQLIRALEHEAC